MCKPLSIVPLSPIRNIVSSFFYNCILSGAIKKSQSTSSCSPETPESYCQSVLTYWARRTNSQTLYEALMICTVGTLAPLGVLNTWCPSSPEEASTLGLKAQSRQRWWKKPSEGTILSQAFGAWEKECIHALHATYVEDMNRTLSQQCRWISACGEVDVWLPHWTSSLQLNQHVYILRRATTTMLGSKPVSSL